MRKVTDWLLFFLMAVSLPAFSDDNVIDEVVWIIGDEAIYKSEVEEQYRQMQYDGQRIDGDPYCVIPEQLAVQKLFCIRRNWIRLQFLMLLFSTSRGSYQLSDR